MGIKVIQDFQTPIILVTNKIPIILVTPKNIRFKFLPTKHYLITDAIKTLLLNNLIGKKKKKKLRTYAWERERNRIDGLKENFNEKN